MGLPRRGEETEARKGVKNDSNIVHRTVLSRPLMPSLLFCPSLNSDCSASSSIPHYIRHPVSFRKRRRGWKSSQRISIRRDKEILSRGREKSCIVITGGGINNWRSASTFDPRVSSIRVRVFTGQRRGYYSSTAGKNFLIKTYDRQLSENRERVQCTFLFPPHFSLF